MGDTCVYIGHVFYTLIHLFHNSIVRVMNPRVSGQCSYTIYTYTQERQLLQNQGSVNTE